MKKQISMLMTTAFLLVGLNSVTFAMNGDGTGDGSGEIQHTIVSTFDYAGEISEAGLQGNGVEISGVDGLVTVYGLGSSHYWKSLGLDKQEALSVGAPISVTGIVVDYSGELKNLVTTMTVDGVTFDLRDPLTGKPLWQGKNTDDTSSSSSGQHGQVSDDGTTTSSSSGQHGQVSDDGTTTSSSSGQQGQQGQMNDDGTTTSSSSGQQGQVNVDDTVTSSNSGKHGQEK